MRLPDSIVKCVGFLFGDWKGIRRPVGTVFFASRSLPDEPDYKFCYAVTAQHVLNGVRATADTNKVHFRMNSKSQGLVWIESDLDQWVLHDDPTVDAAVLPYAPPTDLVDYRIPKLEFALPFTNTTLAEDVGIGDEVAIIGMFANHIGTAQNVPIARTGNIAAMPGIPVRTELGSANAYLVEVRSFGGLSGSPVWANLGYSRRIQGQLRTAQPNYSDPEPTAGQARLMGLVHGHYDISTATNSPDGELERINSGIAIVTPIGKVIEIIDQPALVDSRHEQIRRRRASQ